MTDREPQTRLDPRYSSPGTVPTPWPEAEERAGRRRAVLAVDGPARRPPARHPADRGVGGRRPALLDRPRGTQGPQPRAEPARGTDDRHQHLDEGYDLVVEGEAVRVTDDDRLRALAGAWERKYGPFWHYEVGDGQFHHGAGNALVFAVAPRTVFGFGKGEGFSQTRCRFG